MQRIGPDLLVEVNNGGSAGVSFAGLSPQMTARYRARAANPAEVKYRPMMSEGV